jgi:protein-tyrosine phosphatase
MATNTIPLDISQINEYLYISAFPLAEHEEELQKLELQLIMSMSLWKPSQKLAAGDRQLIWLPSFDSPILPIPLFLLKRGVRMALPIIQNGEKILVHCQAGKHRSVAMASCILISTGMTADQATSLIKDKRPIADPDIWYIKSRILKFESEYNQRI